MDLPEYVSEDFRRSPLVLVAAQLNYEQVGQEVTHRQAREFQKRLGDAWTKLQSAPLMTATMTPGGIVNEPNRQAYRLATTDDAWSLVVNPDSLTMETRSYHRWDNFRGTFNAVADALSEVFDPAAEQRLGLRYINNIPLPDEYGSWNGLIRDSLLGPNLDPQFADSVLASDQRILLQLDEDHRCVLRHGALVDQATGQVGASYLLDLDVYREGETFSPDTAVEGANALHSFVGRLFRACITDTLYGWLKG